MTTTFKQVIVIRKDLNMRKGKMVAQGAHASMAAILNLARREGNDLIIPLMRGSSLGLQAGSPRSAFR